MAKNNTIDTLRKLSVETKSESSRDYGSAWMRWNNQYGTGISRAFEIVPGVSVLIHDVLLKEDYHIPKDLYDCNAVIFMYCLSGHIFHKFDTDTSFEKVKQRQNVILQSADSVCNITVLPKDVKIQMSTIHVVKSILDKQGNTRTRYISEGLEEVFQFMGEGRPYRYFGAVNSKIVQYANLLYVNKRIDFISRLVMEGATINVLANQIAAHNVNEIQDSENSKLSDRDLQAILDLSDYIGKNLDKSPTMKDFKSIAGMSASKLQNGFRYFFAETVNQFVRNARMTKAKELIELTKLSLSEISYSVGINSRSYFSKEFLSYFGVSPKDYRKSLETVKPHFEITYHSTARPNISEHDIVKILDEARKFNSKNDISGCLLYHDGSFFQVLEGNRQVLMTLMEQIENDARHSQVEIIWKGYKALRSFDSWSMGFINERSIKEIGGLDDLDRFDFLSVLEKEKDNLVNKKMFWQQVKNNLIVYMQSA